MAAASSATSWNRRCREGDERLDGLELDPQPHRVAERAVRIRERPEEVGVLVWGRRDDLAGSGEDVHLEHRLVRHPVAEGGRLDAQAGDRTSERDRLQLRDDERSEPEGQRRGHEVLVGAHPGDVGRPGHRVDLDDARQPGGVEAGGVRLGP